MRVLFILILLANLWIYAQGQGILGIRPADEGRDTQRLKQELNADAVTLIRKTAPEH